MTTASSTTPRESDSKDRNPTDYRLPLEKLSPEQRQLLARMIRVNQAGELGAVRIYQGQLAVLGRTQQGPVLKEMLQHERRHLETFHQLLAENGLRPTVWTPVWNVAGVALGAGTALLGKEAAMMCTEAVETVIGNHYNDQLRKLLAMESSALPKDSQELAQLKKWIRDFRDEELEHLDHAVDKGNSREAPFHGALSSLIQGGCKVAIWLSERA